MAVRSPRDSNFLMCKRLVAKDFDDVDWREMSQVSFKWDDSVKVSFGFFQEILRPWDETNDSAGCSTDLADVDSIWAFL